MKFALKHTSNFALVACLQVHALVGPLQDDLQIYSLCVRINSGSLIKCIQRAKEYLPLGSPVTCNLQMFMKSRLFINFRWNKPTIYPLLFSLCKTEVQGSQLYITI